MIICLYPINSSKHYCAYSYDEIAPVMPRSKLVTYSGVNMYAMHMKISTWLSSTVHKLIYIKRPAQWTDIFSVVT